MDDHSFDAGEDAAYTIDTRAPDAGETRDGPNVDRIRRLVEQANAKPKFWLEPLADITLDKSPQWLITDLMPASGLHVLYGAPGTGKSFLALSAALHVASGQTWGGNTVRQGGVVYVASEGGRNFRKRVVAARIALNIQDDVPFALITTAPNLGSKSETDDLIHQIKVQTQALGWKPKLIVVDTLSRSIEDLNESSSQDVMRFVKHAEKIVLAFDALVMPVHHCGKDETKGMRGSSALHGSADAEWMVSLHAETGARQLTVEKMKDGPDKGRLRYDLVDVPLGKDEAGAPIVTCCAKLLDRPDDVASKPQVSERGLTHEATVLTALRVLATLEGKDGSLGADRRTGRILMKARLKDVLVSTGVFSTMTSGAVTKAFKRAWDALEKKAIVDQDEEVVCLLSPMQTASS